MCVYIFFDSVQSAIKNRYILTPIILFQFVYFLFEMEYFVDFKEIASFSTTTKILEMHIKTFVHNIWIAAETTIGFRLTIVVFYVRWTVWQKKYSWHWGHCLPKCRLKMNYSAKCDLSTQTGNVYYYFL